MDNLLKGGQAWAEAEKAKLADLNWQIIAEKPLGGQPSASRDADSPWADSPWAD